MEELRRLAALVATVDRITYEEALLRVSQERPDLLSEPVVNSEPKLKLVSGAKKGTTRMPKLMAVERLDQALQAALRISPQTPVAELQREIFNRDPALYEELRAESSAQGYAARQAFMEAQARCCIVGRGKYAIALAGAREVLGYEGARDASQVHSTPAPATRTMDELNRLVADAKKGNPKLDDVAARKQVFTQRPDLYEHYRRSTTRNTRRSR